MSGKPQIAALISAAICAIPATGNAQDPALAAPKAVPASLHGRVLDATTGRGLEGAVVTAASPGDTLRARTGAGGEWQIAIEHGGRYTLRARMLG